EESFYEAVAFAFEFDTKVMVESAVEGREIEVSVLGNAHPIVSVPGEIVANTDFYSYESKYIDESGAALEIPAKLEEDTKQRIRKTALDAFRIPVCEGMARVDVFLTETGEVIVNEINTLPGFTSISMYPKLLEASGIGYSELLDRLIEFSLQRHTRHRELKADMIQVKDMADYEYAVFTNMCMVCDRDRSLVQDRVSCNWPCITFPGGMVEKGESFVESARREVYEETGLTVKSLKLCGTKQFQDKNDARYVVLFYRTDEFEGKLTSSDEGEVFWIDKGELLEYELAQDFKEMFEVFDSELLSEFYYYEEKEGFRLRLL